MIEESQNHKRSQETQLYKRDLETLLTFLDLP